jgi:hypothetical protein
MSKFHIDPELQRFRNGNAPHSEAAILRQRIYAIMAKAPEGCFTFAQFTEMTAGNMKAVYSARKALVRKGLAERVSVSLPTPTEKNPAKVKKLSAVRLIGAWSTGKPGSWYGEAESAKKPSKIELLGQVVD